jgi:hypothetical protein
MDSIYKIKEFRQDLQDRQDYFFIFLISRKEMRKLNPPAAEESM